MSRNSHASTVGWGSYSGTARGEEDLDAVRGPGAARARNETRTLKRLQLAEIPVDERPNSQK